jgi:simple sugar transport system permease protein
MIGQILQSSALLMIIALGGLVAERSGILNIGLEGFITLGAFIAVAARVSGFSSTTALILTAVTGILPALIFGLFVLRWDANPFIIGLAINLLSAGTVPLMTEVFFATRGSIRLGAISGVPIIVVVLIAAMTVILTWLLLYKTAAGLRMRVAGEEPLWLRAHHVGVRRYQLLGLMVSGIFATLAGGLLSLRIGAYLPNVSSGRGWIALVIIYLGYRRPLGIAAAAVFFGLVEAMAVRAQAVLAVPPTILLALPYIITVVAFVTYSAWRSMPGGRSGGYR